MSMEARKKKKKKERNSGRRYCAVSFLIIIELGCKAVTNKCRTKPSVSDRINQREKKTHLIFDIPFKRSRTIASWNIYDLVISHFGPTPKSLSLQSIFT